MDTFPIYLLRLGDEWTVVLPVAKAHIGHADFWEHTVSRMVAEHYQIPQFELLNLPYCQRRARVVGEKVFYGERPDLALLQIIRKILGNDNLVFCHDEHEKRLREVVREFRRLLRRYRLSDRNPGSF
jgi:hypothetical protein